MLSETALTGRLVIGARKVKILVLNIHGSGMQSPGWPDCYFASKWWSGFIEFKGETTSLAIKQKQILDRLQHYGVPCCVVRFITQWEDKWLMEVDGKPIAFKGNDSQIIIQLMKELGK